MKLIVLGCTQDSGYPQIGCTELCCQKAWHDDGLKNYAVSLALVDEVNEIFYLFDVSPDIKFQLKFLYETFPFLDGKQPTGIFLTHAHIGHYSGLLHFSIEAMDSTEIIVFAMPRMYQFLKSNAPWSQLIEKKNIKLNERSDEASVFINEIQITPFLVPHRDEFSETVGFKITGAKRTLLFIPDIDKWSDWDKDIVKEVQQVDLAFLDGSFYQDGELKDRDMSKIKHPHVKETMDLFKDETTSEKSKIHFIHLNHTNPLLDCDSLEYKSVKEQGFNIAELGSVLKL